MFATLAWQAMRGQSIFAPDALTVAAFGIVFASAAAVWVSTGRFAPAGEPLAIKGESMTPDTVFSVTNAIAVVGWILLAALPGRRWVTELVTGKVLPALFALIYIAIVVTTFAGAEGSFSTLDGVARLFQNPWLLVAGWLHYLAFDLLIGTWEARDARERGVPHLLLVPCLFLTLMFGPAGWLLYLAIRSLRGRGPAASHAAA